MKTLADWVGYQLVWWISIAGAAHGMAWAGPAALLPFALLHLAGADDPRAELRLMSVALASGIALDGLLAATGWVIYATPAPAIPVGGAPVWILALWVAFALTFSRGLVFLHHRPWAAAALGAVGGPLAYLLAGRAWGAVRFPDPAWPALLCLAGGWSIAMPLLARLARRGGPVADVGHAPSLEPRG